VDKPVEIVDKLRSLLSLSNSGENRSEILGIFAKEPIAGQVKTRLCPPFNAVQAAELYRASLTETVATLQVAGWSLVLFFAGEEAFFRRAFPDLPLVRQTAGKLGDRMAAALELLLKVGFRAAALVGSDSPDLPPALVAKAFDALETADAVAVPARDGGYVLIGESRHSPDLFRDVPWSGPRVLEVTRLRAAGAGVALREIGEWDDLDDAASLRRLIDRSPRSATAQMAARFLAEAETGQKIFVSDPVDEKIRSFQADKK